MSTNYTANDIQTLDFRTAIRSRIAMYMGSADNQGVLQCIREIITNSIAEATMGYGNRITVELFEGNKVKISDRGRGCPFGKRDDGTGALEAIFSVKAVQEDIVPPTINHDPEDKDENIDYNLNFTFDKAEKRVVNAALSNSFGFGGHNATVIVKKYAE